MGEGSISLSYVVLDFVHLMLKVPQCPRYCARDSILCLYIRAFELSLKELSEDAISLDKTLGMSKMNLAIFGVSEGPKVK